MRKFDTPTHDGPLIDVSADIAELETDIGRLKTGYQQLTQLIGQNRILSAPARTRQTLAPQGYADPGGYTAAEPSPLATVTFTPPDWAVTGTVQASASMNFPHAAGDVPALEAYIRITAAGTAVTSPTVFGADNLAAKRICTSTTFAIPVSANGPVTVMVAAKTAPILSAGPVDLSALVIWQGA